MERRLIPSLNALAAFEAAARHGSIVGASNELHLSQSAVSRLVKQVEDALQVTLFDRIRQRLVLTEAGRSYAHSLRGMFHDLEETTFRVMAYGVASGSLSIGVFSTIATKWLIPRLPRFQALEPDVVVNCFVRPAPFDFDTDMLDAAIHYGRPVWPGATLEPLFGETLVPVGSPDLPRLRELRTAADLAALPLLHEVTRPGAWHEWFGANAVDNPRAFHGARFDQFGMVAQAAIAGLGVALIPRFLIEEELESGRLVILLDRPIAGPNKYYFVTPHRNVGMRPLEMLRRWLVEESAGLRDPATN